MQPYFSLYSVIYVNAKKAERKEKHMNNSAKRFIAGTAAALILFSGCSDEKGNKDEKRTEQSDKKSSSSVTSLSVYGETISPIDIKKSYDYDEGVMPLYNVAPDESFDIDFSFSEEAADEAELDYHPVTVHTDSSCSEESRIETYCDFSTAPEGDLRATVSPISPILATDSEDDDYIENDHPTWGNAPRYYIAIWYDTNSESVVRLDSPKVIPFTVRHEVNAPNVRGAVDDTGRFKLVWDEVEGAQEYRIYNLIGENQWTGDCNDPVAGAESAYSDSLIYAGSTSETEFDDFAGNGHAIAVHERSVSGKEYVIGQNYGVSGEYYVSAVVDGKESGLGAGVPTADLKLPFRLTDEDDIMFERYADVKDFPLTLDVLNIDGSVTERSVIYTFLMHPSYTGTEHPEYSYQIAGTAITGCVSFEEFEPDKEYPETVGESSEFGTAEPENNINRLPDKDIETIIPVDPEDASKPKEGDGLVERQIQNTDDHVKKADGEGVGNPSEALIYADSAEEEWLAVNLIGGEQEISVEAFPALQDPAYLEDVFYKTYYQNPYILGVTSFAYDYSTFTFRVNYCYDTETIRSKQQEIGKRTDEIFNEIIYDGMSMDDKLSAIYLWLENNCSYDEEALADAEANGFVKTAESSYEDSFNSYGIIVNKKGVCQSYAYAYKLLCTEADIDCMVVTGYLNGTCPHAWNAVSIDGGWYQTDSTNNGKTTGIPYFLYNADSDTAQATGYTEDTLYELDSNIAEYKSDNDSYEYYHSHGLTVSSSEELGALVEDAAGDGVGLICARYVGDDFDKDETALVIAEVFSRLGLEDMLETAGFGYTNGYAVIKLGDFKVQ